MFLFRTAHIIYMHKKKLILPIFSLDMCNLLLTNLVWTVSALGGIGVDGGSLVCDVSDETSLVVGVVGHSLDSAVGKGNLQQKYQG